MQYPELKGISEFPETVRLDRHERGLIRIVILSDLCEAILYPYGAHLTHWQPAGAQPVLWMSRQSPLEHGKPIRGGVPICFPWFAHHGRKRNAPLHGVARVMDWSVDQVRQSPTGQVTIRLALRPGEDALRQWDCHFELGYTITVGESLRMALTCRNVGADLDVYTEALHTYFAVGDVRQVRVYGLENTEYVDKTRGGVRRNQGIEPITITEETDRVYVATRSTCVLNDPTLGRTITVQKSGSDTTVVWDPHAAKAAAMEDLGDDEWQGFLCVETANAVHTAVALLPGQSHTMEARIKVN